MSFLYTHLQTWAENLQSNLSASVSKLTLRDYIRLVIIVGAYALLRPYLLQVAARFQAKDHEREIDPAELKKATSNAANSLRGQVEVPDDSTDEDGEDEEGQSMGHAASGADWGRRARRRQRAMLRKLLDAEEKLRLEEQGADDDRDIEEFLVDK